METQDIITLVLFVSSLVSLINGATNHYSTIDGPWYKKLLRAFLWVTEKVSIVGSKDGARILKLPGQDSYDMPTRRDDGSAVTDLLVWVSVAVALSIMFGGCAGLRKNIDTTQRVAVGAGAIVDEMCGPVEATCDSDEFCDQLARCVSAQIVALKALKSINSALTIAALAAEAGDDAKYEQYVAIAVNAMVEVSRIIEIWRDKSWQG
jgi:hypothetical protein